METERPLYYTYQQIEAGGIAGTFAQVVHDFYGTYYLALKQTRQAGQPARKAALHLVKFHLFRMGSQPSFRLNIREEATRNAFLEELNRNLENMPHFADR